MPAIGDDTDMTTPPGWYAILAGDELDLSDLANTFTQADILFVRHGIDWMLGAASFAPFTDAEGIRQGRR
jgi:hypothetical protein